MATVPGASISAPPARELSAEEQQRVTALQAEIEALEAEIAKIFEPIEKATEGLDEEAAAAKWDELFKAAEPQFKAANKRRGELDKQLRELVPGPRREPFVWLYENLAIAKSQ